MRKDVDEAIGGYYKVRNGLMDEEGNKWECMWMDGKEVLKII